MSVFGWDAALSITKMLALKGCSISPPFSAPPRKNLTALDVARVLAFDVPAADVVGDLFVGAGGGEHAARRGRVVALGIAVSLGVLDVIVVG